MANKKKIVTRSLEVEIKGKKYLGSMTIKGTRKRYVYVEYMGISYLAGVFDEGADALLEGEAKYRLRELIEGRGPFPSRTYGQTPPWPLP